MSITKAPVADILSKMKVDVGDHVNGANNATATAQGATVTPAPSPYNPPISKRDIYQLREDMIGAAENLYTGRGADFVAECAEQGQKGDAHLLTCVLYGHIVYDHSGEKWYFWNGLHWETDPGGNIHQIASDITTATYIRVSIDKHAEFLRIQSDLGENEPDADTAKLIRKIRRQSGIAAKRAKELCKHGYIDSVLKFARATMNLGVKGDQWDARTVLLGVANAVIDLSTGKPVQPDPSQYIRTVAPVPYIAGAKAPTWEKSIAEIFDGSVDKAAYMQRLLGYALSGTCRESDFYVWFGEHGRNGKEFILERVSNAIGDTLAGVIDRELFLKSKAVRGAGGSNESMMALRGRRIAWATETNDGRQFDLAAMKDLSGGHQMEAIPKYGKQQRWTRTHTPIMLTNHLPRVLSQGLAEWDRIKVLSFPLSFVNEPDPAKPNQRKKDATLGERIDDNELPGVLNWLIDGGLDWRVNGLQTPACVKADTARYKQNEDTIGLFIGERCLIDAKAECKPLDLYSAYKFWLDEAAYGKPMGKKRFYAVIEGEKGFKRDTLHGHERFVGIGILAQ